MVLLPGRTFLLTPTAAGKPIAITPDAGVPPRADCGPPIAGQRWRCKAAGVTVISGALKLGLTCREGSPAAKDQLEPNGPGPRSSPHLHYQNRSSYLPTAWPKPLLPKRSSSSRLLSFDRRPPGAQDAQQPASSEWPMLQPLKSAGGRPGPPICSRPSSARPRFTAPELQGNGH